MSVHETQRQLQIAKRVREAGGYARKQTNAYTSGIPDLHLIVPDFMPVDVEVKDLKEVGLKFRRKIEATPLQRETMCAMNDVNPGHTAAFFMVTYTRGRTIYVAYAPLSETHITENTPCFAITNLPGALPTILSAMQVPRISSRCPA